MFNKYKSSTLQEKTVHAMFGTLSVLALVYCVVLLSLVFAVIERKQNSLASRDLTSSLGALEANYANRLASITRV